MDSTKKDFFNFSSINFEHTSLPSATEFFRSSSKWIEYGSNNLFPQEILNLYQNSSPLFSGIINKISELIAGAGFEPVDSEFVLNQYGKEDLNIILNKCSIDLTLFGGYYLEIIWSKNGKNIASINHIPFQKVRASKPSFETGEIESFFICRDWGAPRQKQNTPIQYSTFNPELSKEFPTQILQVNLYNPANEWYASPSYMSIIKQLKIAEQIQVYQLSSITKGFAPRICIINKNGIPTQAEAQKIYDQIKQRYTGAEQAGDFMVMFADGDNTAPEIIQIPEDKSDERFQQLLESNRTDILTAFRMPPCLVGISTAGKLGTTQEIAEQTIIVQSELISPKQKFIENSFNKLLAFNSPNETLTIQQYKPNFSNNVEDTAKPSIINE